MYEKIKKMAKKANVKVSIPQTCGGKTLRNNTNAKTSVAYFLPFLDSVLEQINTPFKWTIRSSTMIAWTATDTTYSILTSLLKRNLFSISLLICHPQAVRHRSRSCGSASGMLFCFNTIHGLPSETVIS